MFSYCDLNKDNMVYVCESIAKAVLFSSHLGLNPPQNMRKQL
jgi:hypothetical protein